MNKDIKEESKTREEFESKSLSRESELEELRKILDQNPGASGPLYCPDHYKDPEFVYCFQVFDPEKPFLFKHIVDLGYIFVKPEEMPGLQESLGVSCVRFGIDIEADRITAGVCGKLRHYLMKIPRYRYKFIQQLEHEKREEMLRSNTDKYVDKSKGFYGEINY
jgi:hypothetical protein